MSRKIVCVVLVDVKLVSDHPLQILPRRYCEILQFFTTERFLKGRWSRPELVDYTHMLTHIWLNFNLVYDYTNMITHIWLFSSHIWLHTYAHTYMINYCHIYDYINMITQIWLHFNLVYDYTNMITHIWLF